MKRTVRWMTVAVIFSGCGIQAQLPGSAGRVQTNEGPVSRAGAPVSRAGAPSNKRPYVTIPNVADLPEAEARRRIRAAGYQGKFLIEKSDCQWRRKIDDRAVCRTKPRIGQKASLYITLYLAGPLEGTDNNGRFSKMPNLIGWHVDRARAHLEKMGYKEIKIETTIRKEVDNLPCRPNHVCAQSAQPGTKSYHRWPKQLLIGEPAK